MNKRVTLVAAIVTFSAASFPVAGCENASDLQQKSDVAQAAAGEKIAAAKKEADQKIMAAQAEADKKTGDMQATFAKTVEDYRHKTQSDLTDLDHKIDGLDAQTRTATGKAKDQLVARLPSIKTKRAAFAADFKTIDTAVATGWDATKARLDREWTDLKALVDVS
jgi:hypothetical protein